MSDNILKRNTDNFSIVDTVANVAVNPEFTKGYVDWKESRNTEKAFVWEAMNALGDEISETIYDNIVNYIDNVGNIDTCKIKALFSMSEVLGIVNNGLRSLIDHMPDELLHLMDLFSINKAFATKFRVNCSDLTKSLKNAAYENNLLLFDYDESLQRNTKTFKDKLKDVVSAVNSSEFGVKDEKLLSNMFFDFNLPDNIYRNYIKTTLFDCLSSHMFNTYDGHKPTRHEITSENRFKLPLYDTLSNNYEYQKDCGLKDGYINNLDTDLSVSGLDIVSNENKLWPKYEKIEKLRKVNNKFGFDPYKIATRIMDGNDLIDNYTGVDREIIDLVLEARADTSRLFNNDSRTRYAYYHRKDAIDYLRFANSFYDATKTLNSLSLSSIEFYNVNPEYLLVTNKIIEDHRSDVLSNYKYKDEVIVNMSALSSVAENLADLCFAIADIREKLKTQAQRNHMRGTFLLVSYIVGEYIKKNVSKTYNIPDLSTYRHFIDGDSTNPWKVDIIEYADTTEYYNLSTVTTPVALSGNTVNYRFWEADGEDVTGIGLPVDDLEYFYLSTLNVRSATSSMSSFLNVLFEMGADEGYIDRRTGKFVPKIVADDIYDQIEANFEELSAKYYMLSNYQESLFEFYGGNKWGTDIYYNWKNIAHASYQVHPYLERFVEWGNLQYSIRSAYGGDSNEEVLKALRTKAISSILGEMGNIINIWDRNANDSTGWKTRYETETHNVGGRNGESNRLQHYDGVFYPSAIEDYYRMFDVPSITNSFNDILKDSIDETSSLISAILPNFMSALEDNGGIVDGVVQNFMAELWAFSGRITSSKLTAAISSVIYGNEKIAYDERYSVDDRWVTDENGNDNVGKFLHFNWKMCETSAFNKNTSIDEYNLSSFPFLSVYFDYVRNIHRSNATLANEYAEEQDVEKAKSLRESTLAQGVPETFYEKWYSHLNLPERDVQRILARLIYYHDDIVDLYLDREKLAGKENSTKYDIFKYGLDKYSNSIILYKNSEDKKKPDYEYSRNQLGEIWFRFNSHPIGFPFYSRVNALTQIEITEGGTLLSRVMEGWMTTQTSALFTHDGKSPRLFVDMEITPGYRFLTLAYCPHEETFSAYEGTDHFMILKTWEDPFSIDEITNENLLSYYWKAPEATEEDDRYEIKPEDISKYGDFQGLFQNTSDSEIYLLWARYDESLDGFKLKKRNIPGTLSESFISLSSAGPTGVALRNKIADKDNFRLGYCSDKNGQGCYTLAFITEFDFHDKNKNPDSISGLNWHEPEIPYSLSTRYGQNYVGRNTKFTSEDTNYTNEFANTYYGVVDYTHNPLPASEIISSEFSGDYQGIDAKDGNSLDRLDNYLTLINFSDAVFGGMGGEDLQVKYYNLNPDASFIPSYCGLRGFMRIWAADYYRQKKINNIKNKTLHSIELLGYSFNHMKERIADLSSQLYEDEDGNQIAVDPTNILSSGFRVYEQYGADENGKKKTNPFYLEVYNPVIRFDPNQSNAKATWEISLSDLNITEKTLSTFRVLMYSVNRGANSPIYACDLSALNNDPPVDHYCKRGTVADDFYLSNRYITPYIVGVVGTPNVLADDFDPYMASGESNYIMGIQSVASRYDKAGKKIVFTFTKQDEVGKLVGGGYIRNVRDMIIDKNTLVVMVYTDNLGEFNQYHMLYHHHGDWPFLSVWNKLSETAHLVTDKEKDKDYFYANEISAIELSNYMGHFEVEHYDTEKDENGDEVIKQPPTTHDLEAIGIYPEGSGNDDEKKRLKVITNGTYSFKVNEDMESKMSFPPNSWEDAMRRLFQSVNTKFNDLSSVLKNGNTYVFELQPPKEIADIIGEVEMEVYGDDGEYLRAYENYVSSMYHVSKYEEEFVPYIHFFEGDVITETSGYEIVYALDKNKERIPLDKNGEVIDTSEPNWISSFHSWKMVSVKSDFPNPCEDLYEFVNVNAIDPNKKVWFTLKVNDYAETDKPVDVIKYTVEEKDISAATRIYANYTTDRDDIELYFNYNNYFNSPFQTRNSRGQFMTVYKPNTYLDVLPGKTGDLNVFVQLRYYNYLGKTCGLKDIPILNYTIKNISDDKPKFSLYNTWCTSTRQIRPSKTAATKTKLSAWLKVDWTRLGFKEERPNDPNPLSAYLMEDYTIDSDISAIVTVEAGSSDSPVGSLTCDIVYEFTDPYLEFLPDLCSGAVFDVTKQGIIHVRKSVDDKDFLTGFGTTKFTLGFKVKKGAIIDEDTDQIVIPVDAINFGGKDKNRVPYDYTSTRMGGIIMDFRVEGGRKINRFLKLEDYNKEFNGFELAGDRRLIKIYRNKKYEA